MQLFLSQLVGSLLQIILFSAVPFLWWYLKARHERSFLEWIGFNHVADCRAWRHAFGLFFAALALAWLVSWLVPLGALSAANGFKSLGVSALPAAFVYAVFHTSLPEEIFFRGFLLKRLCSRFAFPVANAVQAFAFGLVHGVLFWLIGANVVSIVIVSLLPFAIALSIGWLNEKTAQGSILPGWAVHALANLSISCSAALT